MKILILIKYHLKRITRIQENNWPKRLIDFPRKKILLSKFKVDLIFSTVHISKMLHIALVILESTFTVG